MSSVFSDTCISRLPSIFYLFVCSIYCILLTFWWFSYFFSCTLESLSWLTKFVTTIETSVCALSYVFRFHLRTCAYFNSYIYVYLISSHSFFRFLLDLPFVLNNLSWIYTFSEFATSMWEVALIDSNLFASFCSVFLFSLNSFGFVHF